MTSASLLVILFVGTVVGALTGLVVGPDFGNLGLALLAGLLGSIAAVVVRNRLLAADGGDEHTPAFVAVYAILAALIGSMAAKEFADFSEITAPVGIGAIAGMSAALLLALIMLAYHTHPGKPMKLRKRKKRAR